jgi:hypothetical protein
MLMRLMQYIRTLSVNDVKPASRLVLLVSDWSLFAQPCTVGASMLSNDHTRRNSVSTDMCSVRLTEPDLHATD